VSHRRWITLLSVIVSLGARVPARASCDFLTSFETAQKKDVLHVIPARATRGADDPLNVVAVLLKDYLSYAKPPRAETSVMVDVAALGKGQFRATATLGVKRFDAPFSFPGSLNEALGGLTESISQEMKVPIDGKKLAPFLNESPSADAYLRYAEGAMALDGKTGLTSADLERAEASFEEAIHSDYNYVPAYAGLGEALAARAALEDSKPLRAKAEIEMQKAKLLNPYRAKRREDRMNWYLKKARCAEAR
jgi:hypothetical protein